MLRVCIILVFFLMTRNDAEGAFVSFDDQSDFSNTAGVTKFESFESFSTTDPGNADIVTNEFRMELDGPILWQIDNTNRGTVGQIPTDGDTFIRIGGGGPAALGGGPFTISFIFDNPITAFGVDVADFGDVSNSGNLSLNLDGQDFIFANVPPSLPNRNVVFVGIQSDVPFSKISLKKTTSIDGVSLDTVRFNEASVVSTPSTLTILSVAILLIGSLRIRNRK